MLPKEKLVKIMRFANQGFNIKPYRNKDYHHTGIFFNSLINDLQQQIILSDEEYKKHETNLMAVFAFFISLIEHKQGMAAIFFFEKIIKPPMSLTFPRMRRYMYKIESQI